MAEPYIPIYKRNGNKVIKEWDEMFDDGVGHIGLASYVLFADKNGTEHKMMKWIKWQECNDENDS